MNIVERRIQEQVELYETIINEDNIGLARKLEVAEILRILFYVRDGESVSTLKKYNVKVPVKNISKGEKQ